MTDVANLTQILLTDSKAGPVALSYYYDLVNINLERLKMYANPYLSSSTGTNIG